MFVLVDIGMGVGEEESCDVLMSVAFDFCFDFCCYLRDTTLLLKCFFCEGERAGGRRGRGMDK